MPVNTEPFDRVFSWSPVTSTTRASPFLSNRDPPELNREAIDSGTLVFEFHCMRYWGLPAKQGMRTAKLQTALMQLVLCCGP